MFKRAGILALFLALMSLPGHASPGALCSWYLKTDADTLNVAFPDQSATYWSTELYDVPVSKVVIHGTYPNARYFSFHVYDLATRTVDSIADYEIAPDAGSENPFTGVPSPTTGRSYTVTILFAPKPSEGPEAGNTLYAGATADGLPNATGALIYRVYVPDRGLGADGGVGLPNISIEGPAGVADLPQCDPLPPSTGGSFNDIERTSSFPNEIPRQAGLGNQYTDPPITTRFYGLDRVAWDRVPSNPVTDQVPRFKGTFYSNDQNAYLITRTVRKFGDIVVYKAKAPTFPNTWGGDAVSAARQVRYWSLCEYELATERYVQCSADYQSVIGEDGYFRFVISDPDDRPANATTENGVNWLPWGGPYYDGFIGYRQMIPNDALYTQSVKNIPEGTSGATVMGDYWPQVRYCTQATIEAGGFDSCFS